MNRKQATAGEDAGRSLAGEVLDRLKLDALEVIGRQPGEDDKGYLMRLALIMARWSAAGALATDGGEQGAYARQAIDWSATYAKVAKAVLPGEIAELQRQIGARREASSQLRAIKGGA